MSRVTALMKRPRRRKPDSINRKLGRISRRWFGRGTLSIGGVVIGVVSDVTYDCGLAAICASLPTPTQTPRFTR